MRRGTRRGPQCGHAKRGILPRVRRATLLALIALTGCVSRRVLVLENRLLVTENAELAERVHTLEQRMPPEGTWVLDPTLDDVHAFLDMGGWHHEWSPGAAYIRLDYIGHNASFGVDVRQFESADVLFLATDGYLHLDAAANTESLVLLLVQLVALNYELLVGKFQLNAETGEIILSVELPTTDGLGLDTVLGALEQLTHTADVRYPDLQRAAAGLGL